MKRRICLVMVLLMLSSSFIYAEAICSEHEKYSTAYEMIEREGILADTYHWEHRRCVKCEYEWKVLCKHNFRALSKNRGGNTIKYSKKCAQCGYVKAWTKDSK